MHYSKMEEVHEQGPLQHVLFLCAFPGAHFPHLLDLRHLDLTDSGKADGRMHLHPERLQVCAH